MSYQVNSVVLYFGKYYDKRDREQCYCRASVGVKSNSLDKYLKEGRTLRLQGSEKWLSFWFENQASIDLLKTIVNSDSARKIEEISYEGHPAYEVIDSSKFIDLDNMLDLMNAPVFHIDTISFDCEMERVDKNGDTVIRSNGDPLKTKKVYYWYLDGEDCFTREEQRSRELSCWRKIKSEDERVNEGLNKLAKLLGI